MSESQSDPPFLLTVAVVLYHSDLDHLRATLCGLVGAIPGGVSACVFVIDQSCDSIYGASAREICRSVGATAAFDVRYIDRGSNGGYGAGHNAMPESEYGRFHLILNPDVELDKGALDSALGVLNDDPSVVLVAPSATNSRGDEEYLAKGHPSVLVLLLRAFAPEWLKRRFSETLARYELQNLPSSGPPSEVYLVSGCCMLVSSEALKAVGGFDERYFLYFEDYDLTRRLASQGRVVRDHQMQIVHHGGNAARKGIKHVLWFGRGAWRFFNTWGWRWI